MHVSTMRRIDRYVGVPLCWIAGFSHRFFRRNIPSTAPNSILVLKFFGLGSILLSTPFLQQLHSHFPDARILFLSFQSNREILERLPLPIERLAISTSSVRTFVSTTLQALRYIRAQHIDVVFDLEFFSKFSTIISVLSRGRMRVGYELPTFWRRSNLTHPIALDRSAHVTKTFLKQLEALKVPVEEAVILSRLESTNAEQLSMQIKLALGTNGFENIAININAGTTSLERRWDAEHFMEVAEQLLHQTPARRFFFVGMEAERDYIQRALEKHPKLQSISLNCAGELTIGELIALLQRCRFLLTNDSGPMHIAAATGTPVVALFGPESPRFYGPLGNTRVVYKGISCSPCMNVYNAKLFVCPYHARCMKEISVDDVLAAIRSLEEPSHVAHA